VSHKKLGFLNSFFFGISRDSIIKEICNAIIDMTATRQLAIILAFVAFWEIKFEQTTTVERKRF
jgi:hypothetical protein